MALNGNGNGFTREFKKRYPHGAMGGICWYFFNKKNKKKNRCCIKSTRKKGNKKVITVVCTESR